MTYYFLSKLRWLTNVRWNTGATTHSIVIDKPGTYWMESQSPCGTVHDTVHVYKCPPDILYLLHEKDSICEESCIIFDGAANNFPEQYRWFFAGGDPATSDRASPGKVCYPQAGIYPVILIVSNKGGNGSFATRCLVNTKCRAGRAM